MDYPRKHVLFLERRTLLISIRPISTKAWNTRQYLGCVFRGTGCSAHGKCQRMSWIIMYWFHPFLASHVRVPPTSPVFRVPLSSLWALLKILAYSPRNVAALNLTSEGMSEKVCDSLELCSPWSLLRPGPFILTPNPALDRCSNHAILHSRDWMAWF